MIACLTFDVDAESPILAQVGHVAEVIRRETIGSYLIPRETNVHKHQAGDVLVVAINSDASERQLKGEGRPVLPAEARAQLVAAVGAVDYVVIFEETSVEGLLEKLRPDVHAKGTDYTAETVPERAVSRRLGIRVAIVGDAKGHSSGDLIERIRKTNHAG